MKRYLLLASLFLCLSAAAQRGNDSYLPIQSAETSSSLEDIGFLQSYLEGVKLVGMGESTHGTSEFFTMRHKVFKYLVLNHGFNAFFLEADYANCLDIDHYIKSGEGNAKTVVAKIELWPWETQELIDLIEWMRDYNKQNPDNQLSFIGCDLQKLESTTQKIESLLAKYDILIEDSDYNNELTKAMEFLITRHEFLDHPQFEDGDSFICATLLRHLSQMIEEKEDGFFSYRDIKMAENIAYHLNQDATTKGFFWAHNLHVFDIYHEDKKGKKGYKRAGGVLRKTLGDSYLIIAQDFDQGRFNAYRIIDSEGDQEDLSNFSLQKNIVEPGIDGSFGHFFREAKDSILFLTPDLLSTKAVRYLKLHDIGAVFNASPKNPNQAARFSSCRGCFDALILFKNTNATKLID